ncbi:hypothetical protein BofuT4_uP019160.1 [Botrytis cinerea T4]|uniref:Uncharacterized protein n=1 Tax=Botryotinia fuckeliana (strain T4) TaxID=999810 RepID=G2YIS3_BOTF4|nr:hypothetical protein BofuT4_uP019160.1 [Botrytis cinerea T4]
MATCQPASHHEIAECILDPITCHVLISVFSVLSSSNAQTLIVAPIVGSR